MTNEQINAAIAEACGWKEITNCTCGGKKRGCPPGGHASSHTPNYCTDLNAMHEAEKVLNYEQCETFTNTVADIVHAANREKDYPFPWCFARIHATVRQRAEAFLLTLGKWSATDKESLTVGAITEESSAVQSTFSGGSGRASTYGGKGLGIAGATLPPETQITVNGKTFCLADIDKEMTE